MMRSILFPLLGMLLFSCNTKPVKDKIETDKTFSVSAENEEMNLAMAKSKATFKEFEAAFKEKKPEDESFAIKIPFHTPNNSVEHIWLGDVFTKEDKWYGVVDNMPELTKEVNLGDTILLDIQGLSDWMYLSKGVLKGGNTIRVIRNQMSTQEKKDFDQSIGFSILE